MPKEESNSITYYTSSLLREFNVKHAWFTRGGGVSTGKYRSLNFKNGTGDSADNVELNRKRACLVAGFDPEKLVFANGLKHSNKSKLVTLSDAGEDINGFDALVCSTSDVPIGLSVADCVAVFLSDVDGTVVSVIHVGWRGLVEGVIQHTVNKISSLGIRYSNIIAAIGPANQVETYEFSEEDLKPLNRVFPEQEIIKRVSSKWYVDVPRGCELKLRDCGVSKIDNLGINSFLNRKEFFSFRGEKPVTGRNGAVVSL